MPAAEAPAISANGKHLAFVGRKGGVKQVYLRSLEQLEVTPVPDTEGAHMVFFSPDSQWLGYATATRLWKVARGGGQPIPLCEVAGVLSAFWAEDDTIFFASLQHLPLAQVKASGGVPQLVSRRDGPREWIHGHPEVLPGGKALLFDTGDGGGGPGNIIIQSLVPPSGQATLPTKRRGA